MIYSFEISGINVGCVRKEELSIGVVFFLLILKENGFMYEGEI